MTFGEWMKWSEIMLFKKKLAAVGGDSELNLRCFIVFEYNAPPRKLVSLFL